MIPQPGQRVKCFLRTSTVVEGIVENWSPDCAVLKSLDGESLLIIHSPTQDIVLTKVLLPQEEKVEHPPATAPQDLPEQFRQAFDEENTVDLRTQSLVNLHQLKAQQERRITANKLRDHHLGQTQQVKYEQPGFHKNPSVK